MKSPGFEELFLSVKLEWPEVDRVYQEVMKFLSSFELSTDLINTFTMIVCELVENGIKYGSNNSGDRVKVNINLTPRLFSVQVSNPLVSVTDAHLNDLDRTIQWVRGFQDPFEAYIERMKAISHEPIYDDKSGLGIVRITREGHAVLDFYVGENNTLNVSAVADIK